MADLSSKFKDEPISPSELVKYWTEYVLRYKGALHLRTSEADMPLHQYLMFDVISVVLTVATISGYVFFRITKYFLVLLYNFQKQYILSLKPFKFCRKQISMIKKKL